MSVPSIDRKISRPASWQHRTRPVMRVVSAEATARSNAGIEDAGVEEASETSLAPARRMVVRPDRPMSSHVRSLRAVPTAPSPADAPVEVSWKLASAASAPRRRVVSETVWQETGAVAELTTHLQDGFAMLGRILHSLRMRSVVHLAAGLSVAVFAAVAVVSLFGLGPQAGDVYLVQQGDTLTSIAATVDAPVDTAHVIDDIYALNVIDGDALHPGQEVVLPQYK